MTPQAWPETTTAQHCKGASTGVARATLEGRLGVGRIHDLGPQVAMQDLQSLPGVAASTAL